MVPPVRRRRPFVEGPSGRQHDTALVVYELVRVGRTVLLGYEYGEGNGTPASRAQAIALSIRAEDALVEPMSKLSGS